ncbi:gliding motility protein RemB [Mucilaginibacter hurinus]|uniref:Gliding motility protein RemB n=1 Tax=Mucilaginibacter hurinus TaxID=2201324 RepID=A0A367GME9_9SPHI|nr:gliding motility protein RemB [Mucilaginibacter hurinus]RCH54644.1 gliding motility protein RemB [Mucilaginibacter hurinus]
MKKILIVLAIVLSGASASRAQSLYQPYSYQFYQKFNAELYSTKTRIHTALKPFIIDTLLQRTYDSLMNYGIDSSKRSWGYRKLFSEHLVDVRGNGNTFYADVLPDLAIGRDFARQKRNTHMTGVGLQLGGTVGTKFAYNVSGFYNQAVFPYYMDAYINPVGVVPGQGFDRSRGGLTKEWDYITAVVSYTPVKYLNISAGREKTFVGDGYRSLLLSDYSSPMPFFRLTGNLGNVRYMAMWTHMNDRANIEINDYTKDRKKFGVFHYLDWNVNNRLSLGFFDAVIWAAEDDQGHKRGFDVTYINPIPFLRPLEASSGSPDNVLIGLTGKYKITDGLTAYGQFSLDEFEGANFFSGEGSSRNKYGWQVGVKGANLLGVERLNYLLEVNGATPFTYSERSSGDSIRSSVINYSNNTEPLAHPWGANFREVVAILNYSHNRFDFMGELNYGRYGLDKDGLNYGKNIFQNYRLPARKTGNYIGQGLTTNMIYLEGKVAYMLNPKYNLRIELGGIYRSEKNDAFHYKTAMLTLGVRSSFRNIYTDIASFK